MAEHKLVENKQKTYKSQLGFVHVAGRYRVGELLGTGGSGELYLDFSSTHFSELSSECLFRERYQDRSQGCCKDRACRQQRPLIVKTQSGIVGEHV